VPTQNFRGARVVRGSNTGVNEPTKNISVKHTSVTSAPGPRHQKTANEAFGAWREP
jgi:hypothetical protein